VPVGTQTTIDVALEEAVKQMNEVVVTALGIKRESKVLVIQQHLLRRMNC